MVEGEAGMSGKSVQCEAPVCAKPYTAHLETKAMLPDTRLSCFSETLNVDCA